MSTLTVALASSNEYSDGGSGELSGDDLARFHGLVLPRSRGFGDKAPFEEIMGDQFCDGDRVRLPDEGEIITSTRPSEVAFYEAAFPASLRFPLHHTIRNLFSLNSNPKPDQGWLYFKARNKKVLLGGYPNNVKGLKSKFFFVSGDEWEIPEGTSRKDALRVPRTWGIPDKHCNNPPWLYGDEPKVFKRFFGRASRMAGDNLLSGEAPSSSSDVAMSKRVSFKKIGEKLGKTAGASSGTPVPAKGIVIGEKRAEESITARPARRGRLMMARKEKGLRAGTSAHVGTVPGPSPSILGSPSMAERLLRGVIPQADKKKVEKLTLDQTATKLFHVIGQEGQVASMETEVARLQKLAANFEQQLAESRAREQQAIDELAKTKGDRDSLADHLGKSGALVNELREALNKAKESAVEEFKSSSEFMVAVEDAASKYFCEGFDFCKVQLRRHHPDLAIDLEGTVVDQDLLAEQDEAAEERERKSRREQGG
ncbi:hypothetical protein Acr_08g0008650 [Actinidia rufa]|uniref:Uncharacterized protein n=1 Tax=Actinidia rufa TaxID=165716 RepID=A0A7J0F2N3_9ERIC|nr:hypothetical protein Acr_08g0008650 [Actinidia rufa]